MIETRDPPRCVSSFQFKLIFPLQTLRMSYSTFIVGSSNFVTVARIAVLECTETTQKIYRYGPEVDFFSRSRFATLLVGSLVVSSRFDYLGFF